MYLLKRYWVFPLLSITITSQMSPTILINIDLINTDSNLPLIIYIYHIWTESTLSLYHIFIFYTATVTTY